MGRLAGVFVFQAEDGIRDLTVTGVQTCALPIFQGDRRADGEACDRRHVGRQAQRPGLDDRSRAAARPGGGESAGVLDEQRSEEHTSELQSQSNLVCRLLLEKKKTNRLNATVATD